MNSKITLIPREYDMSRLLGWAAIAVILAVASAVPAAAWADDAKAGVRPLQLAQAKASKCLKWKMVKECVQTKIQTIRKPPKDPRNPERDLEVTVKEVCVKWQERATCVSWQGEPAR
jgi:hypothetical protein